MRLSVHIALLGFSISLMNTPLHAVPITFDFQVQVYRAYSGPLSVGDLFTFSLTFDPNGTQAHIYTDGKNQVPEFGEGDDTLYRTMDASTFNLAYVSDAVLTFDRSILGDTNVTLPGPGYFSHINYSRIYSFGTNWSYMDSKYGNYNESVTLCNLCDFGIGSIGAGYSYLTPENAVYGYSLARYDFTTISVSPSPSGLIPSKNDTHSVPEPITPTMLLFGLLGMALAMNKRDQTPFTE